MKKNLYTLAFICFGLILPGLPGSYAVFAKDKPAQVAYQRLPDMLLVRTDGTQRNAQDLEGKVALVLFQPDCDHCQREAVQIREHLEAFKDHTIYFVTSVPLAEIEQFASEYGLKDKENVFFAYTDLQNILTIFGAVPTPSLYLYSSQKRLVKTFNGETPIESILPYVSS